MASAKHERQARTVRLLNLLAYVQKHPDSTVMEMARDLGSDPGDIRDDLNLLHLSGVGKHGGQMIDLLHDWASVRIIDSQGLDKPLRLTPTEASALLLLLESLETMPGLVDSDAVASAAAKIRAVARGAGIDDARQHSTDSPAEIIRQALGDERQLTLTYYSESSDTTSTRTVSPIDIFHRDGHTYLRAWQDDELRVFRFDRIRAVEPSELPARTPEGASPTFDPEDPFSLATRGLAKLRVRSDAAWIADYKDITLGAQARGGWLPATMRYGSDDWLVRFCLSEADRVQLVSPARLAREVEARAAASRRVLG